MPVTGTTYAIGDVQGCLADLHRLLDCLAFNAAHDRLWFCGDLVNRGPDSLGVLRLVKSLGESAVTVLGNHDLHLLARAHGGRAGARDTLDAVLAAPDADDLLHWLHHRPLLHAQGGWLLVHAGLAPQWTTADAQAAARAVETTLRGPQAAAFLRQMYGDQPGLPPSARDGADYLRHAVNALTRLRYVHPDGALELRCKRGPEQAPPGLLPWFAHPAQAHRHEEILFGHWSTLGRVHWPQHRAWGLDTGAVWGGRLTALNLTTRALTQVDCASHRQPGGAEGD